VAVTVPWARTRPLGSPRMSTPQTIRAVALEAVLNQAGALCRCSDDRASPR
jgi:hypothetical protein